MKIHIILLLIYLSIFGACDKNNEDNELISRGLKSSWVLNKITDKITNESDSLTGDYTAEITFHGNNCIHVMGPCNSGGGKFTVNENNVVINDVAMTERGCDELDFESVFANNLSGEYTIEGNKLTIISSNNKELTFTRLETTRTYICE